MRCSTSSPSAHGVDELRAFSATISARSSDMRPAIGISTSAIPALRNQHGAAADFGEPVRRLGHIGLVRADDVM